jgi:hypothetical protein
MLAALPASTREETRVRKTILLAFVVASLIVASSAQAINRPQVINLVDVEERFSSPDGAFDEGPPEVGAAFFSTDALYRWAGAKRGARVGRLEVMCTFTKVELAREAATAYCTAQAYLPAGQILLAGFIRFSEQSGGFRVPVVGGTGAYSNAGGVTVIRDLRSGNQALTLRLFPISQPGG